MVPENDFSSGEKFLTKHFVTRAKRIQYNTQMQKTNILVVNAEYFKGVSREDRKL